jgi:predicted NBD/HSP70 family sugar kinase
MKCLVLDFGGTAVKYCLMDEHAVITRKGEKPSPVGDENKLVAGVKEIYEAYKDEAEGIAISFPGMIDSDTGFLPGGGAFLQLWGKNILDILKPHIPVPISIENDGKCGALSEVWKGSLQDVQDGAVVIIGTGVAGGIIKNRKIHKGRNFTAGELSYLLVKPGDYTMANTMCMQAAMMGFTTKIAAIKGAHAQNEGVYDGLTKSDTKILQDKGLEQTLGKTKESSKKAESDVIVDGKKIFEWIKAGDEAVLAAYREFIQHIVLMIYNLHVVYAPEKIALGGGITREPQFYKDVQVELNQLYEALRFANAPEANLVPCAYLGDANLAGAMYNYLLHYRPDLIA